MNTAAVTFICLIAILALTGACYYYDKYHEAQRQLERLSSALDRPSNLRG